MSKLIPDRDIRELIGNVLIDADENCLNPNGIELRLGRHVYFHSSDEEFELEPEQFLVVRPGENVIISSFEQVDFSEATVQQQFPDCMLMGWVTPTTTMMREGISQVSTKVDSGYVGNLNWRLRNGSTKDLILRYGEPIYKLTLELLEGDEKPDKSYGERERDAYQQSEGIKHSSRRIPAQIPENKKVKSSLDKSNPVQQLKEAGYPFNYISTELVELHGNLETVSKDFGILKREIDHLSDKIETETKTLTDKIQEGQQNLMEKVENLFSKKFNITAGVIIGTLTVIAGAITFFLESNVDHNALAIGTAVVGIVIIVLTLIINNNQQK